MKTLNKKESEERLKWFEKWRATIEDRLRVWMSHLDEDFKNRLDRSPESLMYLEKYLLTMFEKPSETRSQNNAHLIDAIATYIGQVFIENMPDKPTWDVELVKTGDSSEYYFYPYLKRKSPLIGFNPYYNLIPFAVNKRDGNSISNFFYNQLDFYKKNIGSSSIAEPIPGKGGYDYQYFILIKDDAFEMQEIVQMLKDYYSDKKREDKVYFHDKTHVLVDEGDKYFFHFQLDAREEVSQESKEIAINYKGLKDKNVIASCKRRIEFWGDEDFNGNYLNNHIYLLKQIEENKNLLIFNFRNGLFFDEF